MCRMTIGRYLYHKEREEREESVKNIKIHFFFLEISYIGFISLNHDFFTSDLYIYCFGSPSPSPFPIMETHVDHTTSLRVPIPASFHDKSALDRFISAKTSRGRE